MQLSITMMVKNESKYLEACLTSLMPILKELRAELIIVDTGSEDNTIEIAKKFTDKVYFHEWNNNFADMRNLTISYAKGDWIFVIDGDEIIEDPEDIINFFKTKKHKKYKSGVIKIKNYTRESKYSFISLARVFKKDKDFKYIGTIHEQPIVKYPVYFFNMCLAHYGYMSTDKELMERKFIRNTELLKSELEKEPENIYYWFQLSQSYACYGGNKEGLNANLKAYEIAKKKKVDFKRQMYIYTHLAKMYHVNWKYKELEEICKEALKVKDGYLDLYFLLAQAQQHLNKFEEAIDNYEKHLEMAAHYEDFAGYKDISVATSTLDLRERVKEELCVLYEKQGHYDMVITCANKIKEQSSLERVLKPIIKAYINLNKYDELYDFYLGEMIESDDNFLVKQFEGQLENMRKILDDQEKQKISSSFAQSNNRYGLLNKIRLLQYTEEQGDIDEWIKEIQGLDFKELPAFYGELIYYLIIKGCDGLKLLSDVRETSIQSYCYYLLIHYKIDFLKYGLKALENQSIEKKNTKVLKGLARTLLLFEDITNEDYETVFKKYIELGIEYICSVYRKEIIEKEKIYDVKNEEESFLIYMYHAELSKPKDTVKYIQYLKKALNVYPSMKNGVEIILEEIKQVKERKVNNGVKNELEEYKTQIKKEINGLINDNRIKEAAMVLKEYEKIVPNDLDIYSIKSTIYLMEGKLEEAEIVLKEGLKNKPEDFDMNYNIAYLYQVKGEYDKAKSLYEKLLVSAVDFDLRMEIEKHIKELDFENRELTNESDDMQYIIEEDKIIENELEQYKRQIKKKINELIKLKSFNESKSLIEEYEKLIPNDIEILMYKSQIAVLEI